MIRADSKRWARFIFNPYEELLLKRNFSNFYITGELTDINPGKGLIITPNHISWWDGFFIDYISRIFIKRNFHIMMLEDQLKAFPFFNKTGAFSINPGHRKGILKSLDYAADIVNNRSNLLVFYPQGKIEPFDKKVEVKPGLNYILNRCSETDILPAAFRIEYENNKKPAVYFRPGKLLSSDVVKDDYEIYKKEFISNILSLKCDIHSQNIIADIFTGKR
jgi:1-acyl-sn-glycerol-3-phosphate acyltransferase